MTATEFAPRTTRPWTGGRTAAVVASAFGLLSGAATAAHLTFSVGVTSPSSYEKSWSSR